jgi:hypothetical protein
MHPNDPPFNGKQSPKIKKEYGEGNGGGNGWVGISHNTQRSKMNMEMEKEMDWVWMSHKSNNHMEKGRE